MCFLLSSRRANGSGSGIGTFAWQSTGTYSTLCVMRTSRDNPVESVMNIDREPESAQQTRSVKVKCHLRSGTSSESVNGVYDRFHERIDRHVACGTVPEMSGVSPEKHDPQRKRDENKLGGDCTISSIIYGVARSRRWTAYID